MRNSYHTQQRCALLAFFVCARGRAVHGRAAARAMGDAAPGRQHGLPRRLTAWSRRARCAASRPESGGSAAYQAMDPGHCDAHLHLKCVGCGRLIHLDTGVSDTLQADLLRAAGFTVDGRSTTIYGTCAACGGKRGGHA